eukprot:scaffold105575_cov45-Phaeocystis_antarctica.AAC.2
MRRECRAAAGGHAPASSFTRAPARPRSPTWLGLGVAPPKPSLLSRAACVRAWQAAAERTALALTLTLTRRRRRGRRAWRIAWRRRRRSGSERRPRSRPLRRRWR